MERKTAKQQASIARSSAAEYLTFIAATGDNEHSIEWTTRMKTSG